MTVFSPRTTATRLAWLACLLAVAALTACSPAPLPQPASTPMPASPTVAPSATHTPSPAPSTATETAEPATATASATARPSQTRAASATPTATTAATSTSTVAPTATTAGSGDFSPTQAQVWNTAVVGGDNTTGSCAATANAPYGLVLLTPGAGTLAMHNTVPEDYVLTRLGDNAYQYSGASALGDGTLTLDVRFTSATTLSMSRVFVSNAEPGCTHQHNYTGTFRNNR